MSVLWGEATLKEGDECAYVQCTYSKFHKGPFVDGDNNAANDAADEWNRRSGEIEIENKSSFLAGMLFLEKPLVKLVLMVVIFIAITYFVNPVFFQVCW